MVNSLFEARGDEFRVNPNKIDFEEAGSEEEEDEYDE